MYLWRAHNQVTRRLLMTAADPVYPKFFPLVVLSALCATVRQKSNKTVLPAIDERRVFTFLLEMYGKPDTQKGARGLSSHFY